MGATKGDLTPNTVTDFHFGWESVGFGLVESQTQLALNDVKWKMTEMNWLIESFSIGMSLKCQNEYWVSTRQGGDWLY